jgi:ABC-type glycerol-3-phosphate transport system substrate-binding protein
MTRRWLLALALLLGVAACAPDEGPGAGTSAPAVTDGAAPTQTESSDGPYDY